MDAMHAFGRASNYTLVARGHLIEALMELNQPVSFYSLCLPPHLLCCLPFCSCLFVRLSFGLAWLVLSGKLAHLFALKSLDHFGVDALAIKYFGRHQPTCSITLNAQSDTGL